MCSDVESTMKGTRLCRYRCYTSLRQQWHNRGKNGAMPEYPRYAGRTWQACEHIQPLYRRLWGAGAISTLTGTRSIVYIFQKQSKSLHLSQLGSLNAYEAFSKLGLSAVGPGDKERAYFIQCPRHR